jgi:uncharacterized protein YacL
MNEKDINEIIITIIICLFFIVVFVFIDGISDPNSEIGLKIYKIFHEPFGIGFVGIIIIIIFSLFISSVITKQSSQMKSAIIMLTILLTALYTLNLNMTSKDKNKKIDEYRSKSGSSFDAAGAIGAAAGAAGAAAGL